MATLTTRNLFDAIFDNWITPGAKLFPFEDVTSATTTSACAESDDPHSKAVVVGAASSSDDLITATQQQQQQQKSSMMLRHGDDEVVQKHNTFSNATSVQQQQQPFIELDLEDASTIEATIGGLQPGDDDVDEEDENVEDEAAAKSKSEAGTSSRRRTNNNDGAAATSSSSSHHAPLGGRGVSSSHHRQVEMTAAEQLRLMPIDGPDVFSGVCVLHNQQKGFGFISPDIGGPDVYYTRESMRLEFSRWLDELLSGPFQALLAGLPHGETLLSSSRRAELEEGLRLLQLGKPFLVSGELVQFRVASNVSGGGGGGGGDGARRRLRAVRISGMDSPATATPTTAANGVDATHRSQMPLIIERVLLGLTEPKPLLNTDGLSAADISTVREHLKTALGENTASLLIDPMPEITISPDHGSALIESLTGRRISGWIKNVNSDGDRGYIRPDSSLAAPADAGLIVHNSDGLLYTDAVVWDVNVPMAARVLIEGVLVEYSVVCFDRMRKPVAALVTGPRGTPLDPESWELTEVAKKRLQADRDEESASGGGRRGGTTAGGGSSTGVLSGGAGGGRKRSRTDEEQHQLFLVDDGEGYGDV